MKAESLELCPAGMSRSKKREQQTNHKGARSKKLRYAILEEEWGKEQPEPKSPSHQTPAPPSTPNNPIAKGTQRPQLPSSSPQMLPPPMELPKRAEGEKEQRQDERA